MKKVVVVGAGGFGREVLEVLKDMNKVKRQWDILGFVDDNPAIHGTTINKMPVLGGTDWLIANHGGDIGCLVAMGDPSVKRTIVAKLNAGHVGFVNAIHPTVVMSEFVEMGVGNIICAGCILTVNIKLGNHIIINLNCTIGHDTVIEDYCSMMPTVKINGCNHLHEGVYVGTGASFIHNVSVGEWTTIGAGAAVVKDIPDHVTAVGVPASKMWKKEGPGEGG